jgi:hypothetical protein
MLLIFAAMQRHNRSRTKPRSLKLSREPIPSVADHDKRDNDYNKRNWVLHKLVCSKLGPQKFTFDTAVKRVLM